MVNDFIHEKEKAALENLRSNELFKFAMKAFNSAFANVTSFAEIPLYSFPITETTNERIFAIYQRVRERIGVKEEPHLFMQIGYELKADIIGGDDECFIVLQSECIAKLSDEELSAILGQALTHVKYKHVGLMNLIENFGKVSKFIPHHLGNVAKTTFYTLCIQWLQYANFTADRGAAIASGSFKHTEAWLSKCLGFTNSKYLNLSSNRFWQNASNEGSVSNLIGRLFFQQQYKKLDAPFGVLRLNELYSWCKSEACLKISPRCYYTSDMDILPDDAEELYKHSCELTQTNKDEELKLLFSAAEKKYSLAMAKLGYYMLYSKQGLERNVQNLYEGLNYLRLSAIAGISESQFYLGICFINGIDGFIDKDFNRGILLIRLAAGKGYLSAINFLETENIKIQVLSESSFVNAINSVKSKSDFLTFTTDYDNPEKGLNADNFSMYNQLMNSIGYSTRDKLYAVEYVFNNDVFIKGIAVTSSGIYFSRKNGLADCILWDEYFKGAVTVKYDENITRLMRSDELIYECDTKERDSTIFGLLYAIYKVLHN